MSKTGCYENPYAVTGGEAVHSRMQAQRKDLKIPKIGISERGKLGTIRRLHAIEAVNGNTFVRGQ